MAAMARRRRGRPARQREGAVMLVVMLILLVSTATAAVSVQSTQYELRSAGYQRESQQARYVSEIAIMTTLAWVDTLGDQFLQTWTFWENQNYPDMAFFGEPDINPAFPHHASRAMLDQVTALQAANGVAGEHAPTNAADTSATPPESFGSLGPRSATLPRPYVVDITDCQQSTAGHTPGAPIGGGSGSAVKIVSFYCTMTAHARLCAGDGAGGCASDARSWAIGADTYGQERFDVAHDSRATFITPEMIVSVE